MALGQVLAGTGLLMAIAQRRFPRLSRASAVAAGASIMLIGGLTLSEHLLGTDLGIDQLLASEPPGAIANTTPNRMGVPGSSSLFLLGVALILLVHPTWARIAGWLGSTVCVINLIPAVGFLYGIQEFYSLPPITGIAWSTVVALLAVGFGVALAPPPHGLVVRLLREDAGGALLRKLLPAVILIPLILGFIHVRTQQRGLYDAAAGTGALIIVMVLGFVFILWLTADSVTHAAAAQAKSEQRFRTLFETMTEAFALHEIICDADGKPVDYRFLEVNAAFEKQSGLRRSDVVGRTVRDTLPGIEPEWIATFGEVATRGRPIHFERYNVSTNRVYSVRAFCPAPLQFACVFLDITERKRTEDALRYSEKRYKNLFDSIDEGFCIIDVLFDPNGRPHDFRYVEVNPAFERHNGLEHATGRRVSELIPDLEARWFETYGKVAKTGESTRFEEFAAALDRWFDVFAFRVGAPSEHRVAILFNNITARKRAEAERMRLAHQLQLALDAARMGKWRFDVATKRVTFDDRCAEVMGAAVKSMTLDAMLAAMPQQDAARVAAAMQTALTDGNELPFSTHHRVLRPDGTERWVESHGAVVYEGEGSHRVAVGLVGAVQDVTERVHFQHELQRLVAERTAQLQEAIGELEHYSYTITHDLRAPLRTMRSFAAVLAETCGRQEEQTSDCIDRIIRAADRMDGLITDALNYSRAARQDLQLHAVDPRALLSELLVSSPELRMGRAQIQLEGDIPFVVADRAALAQCFRNLLSNAVKFVKPGEVPQITIRAEALASQVRLWVEDKGIGIPEEMCQKVFEMFCRAHADYEGSGIGLALVRKVIERFGGRVGVISKPGEGSRFWMDLNAAGCAIRDRHESTGVTGPARSVA